MSKLEKYLNDFKDYRVPETMKAVLLTGAGFENIFVKEIKVPEVGPKQLLARVDAAGVCTSVLKIIEQGAKHKYPRRFARKSLPILLLHHQPQRKNEKPFNILVILYRACQSF